MADQVVERLAAALEEFIIAVGRGVAQAQLELDRSSIAVQKTIDTDPVLSQAGLQASWFRMPRTELEVKVALAFSETTPAPAPSRVPGAALLKRAAPALMIQPVNARYQNQFRYDGNAASTLRMTIVPVPPSTTAASQLPPKLSEVSVRQAAEPLLDKRADTKVVINFSTSARVWFVIQFTETADETQTVAVVEVNDNTGAARRT